MDTHRLSTPLGTTEASPNREEIRHRRLGVGVEFLTWEMLEECLHSSCNSVFVFHGFCKLNGALLYLQKNRSTLHSTERMIFCVPSETS